MDERAWPWGRDVPAADLVRESWAATVAALPVEARITGEVIGRRPFGAFIRVGGVPYAVALAEITAMPLGMDLPALGAFVGGEIVWHVAHNQQVKVRLDEWWAVDE
ncbi:hypothetical protein [Streptomyces sp. NPDC090057]|uniref:hypothetical protein n=1 Tax=Streptomyces sp. NPDC090057 TaxID=3365935 RepID=UPI003827CD7F